MQRLIYGEGGADILVGQGEDDQLYGGLGDDILVGGVGIDTLDGGLGSDKLIGDGGDDILGSKTGDDFTSYRYNPFLSLNVGNDYWGGTGNDNLNGSQGADTYYFNAGDGMDTIDEIGGISGAGFEDKALFGTGINPLDLIFAQNGNNLDISNATTGDRVSVREWYGSIDNQVENIALNDGTELLNTQVNQLIQAMATFSADNGSISWEQAIQDRPNDVQAVIAAYWQPAA